MSGFLLPAALLVLLAVAFAVSALWQKSRGLALAIAVVLPLAVVGLYAFTYAKTSAEAISGAQSAKIPTVAMHAIRDMRLPSFAGRKTLGLASIHLRTHRLPRTSTGRDSELA